MAKKSLSIKKKKWYPILSPKIFNEYPLGETFLVDPMTAIGRQISVSLMTITNDPQKQNIYTKFLITSFADGSLKTEPLGYKLNTAGVKRLMRRRRSKIEDSFVTTTIDKKQVRVKPVLITRIKAQGGIKRVLKKELKERLIKKINSIEFEQFLRELTMKKIQRPIADELRKFYPIGILEIKEIKIILPRK